MKLVEPFERTEPWPPRNAQGRPIVPHPDDPTRTRTFLRPSSYGKVLLDQTMIERAYRRKILRGVGLQPGIAEQAVPLSVDDPEDRKILDQLVDQAGNVGGAGIRADLGTSMHHILETFLKTGEIRDVAETYRSTRDALLDLLQRNDIRALSPEWVEPFAINYPLETAGSFDFGAVWQDEVTIFDLKTGKYSPTDFDNPISHSTQLYLYASATHFWSEGEEQPAPINERINTERGFIIWAPLGEGTAELFEINLDIGRDLVHLASQVREARSAATKRHITKPIPGAPRNEAPSESSPSRHRSPWDSSEPQGGGSSPAVASPAEAPPHSSLAERVGELRRRLRTLVDRGGCPMSDIRDLMIANELPALKDYGAQTWDTVDTWGNIVATLELAHGITAPSEARLRAVMKMLGEMPPHVFADVQQVALEAGIPNLKTPMILDADLDRLEEIVSRATIEYKRTLERVQRVLDGFDDTERESLMEWAGVRDLGEADELGESRLSALALAYRLDFFDDTDEALDELVSMHGSKRALIAAAKTFAKAHNRPLPISSSDVIADRVVAALLYSQTPTEGTNP